MWQCKLNVPTVLILSRAAGRGSTQDPGKLHTLVPQTGHGIVADSRVKRKCPWLVVGDFPPINDNVAEQGFCAHGRQIENCRLCGGRHICPRSRRRCQCSILQGAKLWSTVGDGSKNSIQHYAFESSQAATPRTSEHVGKCSRAPSASIGSAEEWLKEV